MGGALGGGAPDIPQRNLGNELGQIFGAFKGQELPLFNKFFNKQPLLAQSRDLALAGIQGYGPVIQALLPTLQSLGKLTPEQARDVDVASAARAAQMGMGHTTQGLVSDFLNRDIYRRQRFGEAVGQANQLLSGAITPALAAEQAATGGFSSLLTPLLGFGQDVFSSNQNAAAVANQMAGNKQSGLLGTGTTILGAAATAY